MKERKDIFRKNQNGSDGNPADTDIDTVGGRIGTIAAKSKGRSLGRKGIGYVETICGIKQWRLEGDPVRGM